MQKKRQGSLAIRLVLLSVVSMFLILLGGAMFSIGAKPMTSGEDRLRQLNEEYIRAFMKADVAWYQQYLADDFVCIESDGSVLGKAEFLHQTAKGPDVATYKLDQVHVRIYGDVALVQATGLFTRKDGSAGKSRYTDIYVRTDKEWRVVSAQITRTSNSDK